MARYLPGSVAVVAALTVPEFSVGAGDLADVTGFDDRPEPAARPQIQRVRLAPTTASPALAGVRYAPILELDRDAVRPAPMIAARSDAPAPAAEPPLAKTRPEPSLPLSAQEAAPDFIAPPPVAPMTPGAEAPEAVVPASWPVEPVAAMAVIPEAAPVPPALFPAIVEAPSQPQIDTAEAAPLPPVPMPGPVPVPVPVPGSPAAVPVVRSVAPAPAAAPAPAGLATPIARVEQARPVAHAMTEQTAPARIAAAPSAMAATIVPVAVVAVPLPAPAPSPEPAASAPLPASLPEQPAAAMALPRPSSPALAAPVASLPAMPAVTARLLTRVDGKTAGAVDFQQTPAGLKVRLGSIVEVLADRYDSSQLARIRASSAGDQYLSLAELQAQGVPISYDPVYDEFNVGLTDTRPKAARKVHMDQISTPERGLGAIGMEQIRR